MKQQIHIHQYTKVMQQQKHQQAKHYDKSVKDLHSLETGNVVHVQLVPNVRKWVYGTIIEKNQWQIIQSQDCIRSCLCEELQNQAHRLKTES